MHLKNFELLRKEALRLLNVECEILQEMLDQNNILTENIGEQKQTFDKYSTPKEIEVLSGEKKKLANLEMVLAIVGTMKAGKSTSINAIVGNEVMPNRNRPMTAIPTLIRHRQGLTVPILNFHNYKPISNLLELLKKEILKQKDKTEGLKKDKKDNDDIKEILNFISSGAKPKEKYEGPEEIFEFLKILNDLVRICNEYDVDFPFTDYDEIHELPVIEIEFSSLKELENPGGVLTLLDTPGPNESKQKHLKTMLKEQMKKASAVLAVLDYSQLKSEADEEVREYLREISEVSKGRLFALVNKFDEKDRNCDDESSVKKFISQDLLKGILEEENNIYPVSAKLGFLANKALYELEINGCLPDIKENPWVKDFAKEAFGSRWENKLNDVDEAKECAEALWKESLFQKPLEEIIEHSYNKSAIFAIDSSASKLLDTASRIENFLNTRDGALSKDIKELQKQIDSLQNDIERVEESEKNIKKSSGKMLKKLDEEIEEMFENSKDNLQKVLDSFFKEGKLLEKKHFKEAEKDGDFFKNIGMRFKKDAKNNHRWNPQNPVINFYGEKKAAEDFVNNIQDNIQGIFVNTEIEIKKNVDKGLKKFQKDFKTEIEKNIENVKDSIKNRLDEFGFNLNIEVPSSKKLEINVSAEDVFENVIKDKSGWRDKDGGWAKISRFFSFINSDWGREYVNRFEIDMNIIKNSCFETTKKSFSGIENAIEKTVKVPLNESIEDFFSTFKTTIENIRSDFLQGIKDKQKNKKEQEELVKSFKKLIKKLGKTKDHAALLKNEVETVINGG